MKKVVGVLIVILYFSGLAVFAAGSSSISFNATQVYDGLYTQGTLPSTNFVRINVTSISNLGNAGKAVITPHQQTFFKWYSAGSSCTFGSTGSCTRTLSDTKPTKLFIKSNGAATINVGGNFRDY